MLVLLSLLLACPAPPPAGCPDADADGWCADEDCSDTRSDIHPDQPEVWYDGADGACDGGDDFDQDEDGWTLLRETAGADYDDVDPAIYPGAPMICGNGRDDDCNRWPDCSPSGVIEGRSLSTRSLFGGGTKQLADLDGDGLPEWGFLTDVDFVFVQSTSDVVDMADESAIHLIAGYPRAVGPAGGLDGDDVASVSLDIFSDNFVEDRLPSSSEASLSFFGERPIPVGDLNGDGWPDIATTEDSDLAIYYGPFDGVWASNDVPALRLTDPDGLLFPIPAGDSDGDGGGEILVQVGDVFPRTLQETLLLTGFTSSEF